MWGGVTKGLAGIKFSGSDKQKGESKTMVIKITKTNINPRISFHEKKGWNKILSILLVSPRGLFEPVSCKNIKWIIINIKIIKGKIKCKEKKTIECGFINWKSSSNSISDRWTNVWNSW